MLGRVFSPDLDLHNKMVDEVRIDGRESCRYLRYTGSETMMHPQIFEMLEYAALHSGTAINVTTNGTVLGERRAKRLLDSGVHVVDISLDAFYDETYAVIQERQSGKNKGKFIAAHRLSSAGLIFIKDSVSFVEQPQNTSEAEKFETYWKEQGS